MTGRGRRVAASGVFVASMGAFTLDAVLMVAGLAIIGWVVYSYLALRAALGRLDDDLTVLPDTVDGSLTAGEVYEEPLEVRYSLRLPLKLRTGFGGLGEGYVPIGRTMAVFRFNPNLSGDYRFEEAEAKVTDAYGLVRGLKPVGLRARLRVYPRVVSAALMALSMLEGAAGELGGEVVSTVKGDGLEYADSREYVPGDPLRRIDWKVTARLDRLYVKEYYREGAGSIHVFYEAGAPDPVSADELAAAYLRSVMSFAEIGWVMGLTVVEGGETVYSSPELHPSLAVSVALGHVLRGSPVAYRELYALLDPGRRPRLLRAVEQAGEAAEAVGKPSMGTMVVSPLTGNASYLMELSFAARASGARPVILEPCKPWAEAEGEEAEALWRHYDKVNRSLMREGWGVAVTVEEAYDKMVALMPGVVMQT